MIQQQGILLDNVSMTFGGPSGPVHAVRTTSLAVERGTSLAVTGPSGSGKSTLVALMGGLAKPTSGRVCVNGVVVSDLSERRRAQLRPRAANADS